MTFETNIDAEGVNCFFSGDKPIFAFGDGRIFVDEKELVCLEDGIYSASLCPLTFGIIALGDDGKVTRVRLNGEREEIYHFKNSFADFMTVNAPSKRVAVALSRKVAVINLKDNKVEFEFEPPMSPTYVAFDQLGDNLVVAHGKGMTIYDLKSSEEPLEFPVGGGVFACAFSPNLHFLVAATAEPAMVGWRLSDGAGFRMAGYPAKPNSLAWVEDGAALLTSGGPVAVLWPFFSDDGPMGMNAKTFRTRNAIVTSVASQKHTMALGYNDGGIDIIDVGAEDKPRNIGGTAPDTANQLDSRSGNGRIVAVSLSQNARFVAYIGEDGLMGCKKLF